MVRAVVVLIISVFIVLLGLMVGIAAIEPVADAVTQFDSIDNGPLEGTSVIDDVQTTVFEYMPLIVIAGLTLWAFRWYLRRERFVGRQR